MAGRGHAGLGQGTVQAQGQLKGVVHRQAVARHLVRQEAAILLGIAIAGGNHRGDQQPQAALLERQGLGVAQGDGAALLGCKVAQVQAVAVVMVLLQHDCSVAF